MATLSQNIGNSPTGPTEPASCATGPSGQESGASGPSQDIKDFFKTLKDLPVEALISEAEANEAITLFSVANMLLAGKSNRRVGNEDKIDVLGVLTLYYGLQDKSLTSKLVVNSQELWKAVELELKSLRDELDKLGSDVVFLEREGRRQFNLGLNNDVVGNTEFPRLFKRYIDIANDPLLTLDLRVEDTNMFSDKEKIGKAIDLLIELKGVILQLVRSLSKYGTIATSRVNTDWAKFENRALKVLIQVSNFRLTDDIDERHPYAVLADLIGKNRDTEIAPYAVLARDGGQLLKLAMETYEATRCTLDNFDRDHVINLFQHPGNAKDFLTTRMRTHSAIIKRYPLANWG